VRKARDALNDWITQSKKKLTKKKLTKKKADKLYTPIINLWIIGRSNVAQYKIQHKNQHDHHYSKSNQ